MSMIETVSDVDNTFLARRELVCNFAGLGGKLKKLEAVEMILKEFKLDGKVIIPIKMKNHVGKPLTTGTFYVYDDEDLAKKQVDPTVLARLEKAKKKEKELQDEKEKQAAEQAEAEKPAESADAPAEQPAEAPPAEQPAEAPKDAPAEQTEKTQ